MAYRAIRIQQDPLNFFLDERNGGPFLRVSDVILRENKNPREIFAHLIRIATASKWSHSSIVYLVREPDMGYNNTFLIEAKTKGVHIASWRNEVVPYDEFTVGIKRPNLDWYMENPLEQAWHDSHSAEDTHGIEYLRHARGIAFDQINGLYDKTTVYELSALYAARAARRHLSVLPQAADAAQKVADFFKQEDEKETSRTDVLRFICSGLVQYSFFEALRLRIARDIDNPAHREAAEHNLRNMQRVIFRDDSEGIIPDYIHKVQSGQLDIHQAAPGNVLDLLKTATPADFNNSSNLEWRFVTLKGAVWKIEPAADGYLPTDKDEQEVLDMLSPEHFSS